MAEKKYLLRRIKIEKIESEKQGVSLREICFYKEIKKEAQRYYLKDGQSDHKMEKVMKRRKRGQKLGLRGKGKNKKLGILLACLMSFYKLCALNYYYRGGGIMIILGHKNGALRNCLWF